MSLKGFSATLHLGSLRQWHWVSSAVCLGRHAAVFGHRNHFKQCHNHSGYTGDYVNRSGVATANFRQHRVVGR